MAETFTNKLEKFFDNNTPGGYITTSVSISDSDLDQRINTAVKTEVSGQGFAKASELSSYVKITSLASVATSGSYNDLKDKPTIPAATSVSVNRNLTEGTKIATITVNGSATELFAPVGGGNESLNLSYLELTERPSLASPDSFTDVAFTGDYNDLSNKPEIDRKIDQDRINFILNTAEFAELEDFGAEDFYLIEIEQDEDNIVYILQDALDKYLSVNILDNTNIWQALKFVNNSSFNILYLMKVSLNEADTNIYTADDSESTTLNSLLRSLSMPIGFGVIIYDITKKIMYFKFVKINLKQLVTQDYLASIDGYPKRYTEQNAVTSTLLGYPTAPDINSNDNFSQIVTKTYLDEILKNYQKKN